MYEYPELFDTIDYKHDVDQAEIGVCRGTDLVRTVEDFPCSDEDMFQLCVNIMMECKLDVPENAEDAYVVYITIRPKIRGELL